MSDLALQLFFDSLTSMESHTKKQNWEIRILEKWHLLYHERHSVSLLFLIISERFCPAKTTLQTDQMD